MHLKSLTLKGFKSFPDRTRLAFGPGVSVIVGPNGSGKSNVTDAVLWALGEQSPLAVRGQTMQDVIFGGGHGRKASQEAEVELVLDNGDGTLGLDFSEVSILRRLDRSGDGEYRLNGARCRLVDVLELLSDTGLGKEAHSVVSQGRVEAIVTSKPRDRRLLIEEAAGLGKHRKRRRRAQLKLARTQDNLDRALDVEREARSRLRPLKRQAEAAELHARLERQSLEARWELGRDALRASAPASWRRPRQAAARRARAQRRGRAGARGRRADAARRPRRRSRRAASSARRCPSAPTARAPPASASACGSRRARDDRRRRWASGSCATRRSSTRCASRPPPTCPTPRRRERVAALEAELAALEQDRQSRARARAGGARAARATPRRPRRSACSADVEARARRRSRRPRSAAEAARASRREAERAVEAARREAARVGGELAAANQFLRAHAGAPGGAPALADALDVDGGYELALAAALDGRLRAARRRRPRRRRRAAGARRAATAAARSCAGGAADAAEPRRQAADARRRAPARPRPRPGRHARARGARCSPTRGSSSDVADVPDGFAGTAVTRDGPRLDRRLARAAPGPRRRRGARAGRAQPPRRAVAESEAAARAEHAALAARRGARRGRRSRRRRARRGRGRDARRRARARRGGRAASAASRG